MGAFFEYARNITYYLLFAALVGMAVPDGKYQKYVGLVMGLVMICLILQPLRQFVDKGLPVTQLFEGIVPVPSESTVLVGEDFAVNYEAWRYETLKTAFEEQLNAQLSGLLVQKGYQIQSAVFSYTEDFSQMEQIAVTVSPIKPSLVRQPFIYIEPVRISGDETAPANPESEKVKKIIADFYNIPPAHIYVKVI